MENSYLILPPLTLRDHVKRLFFFPIKISLVYYFNFTPTEYGEHWPRYNYHSIKLLWISFLLNLLRKRTVFTSLILHLSLVSSTFLVSRAFHNVSSFTQGLTMTRPCMWSTLYTTQWRCLWHRTPKSKLLCCIFIVQWCLIDRLTHQVLNKWRNERLKQKLR